MAGSLIERARFIARLALTMAKRALPHRRTTAPDDESLIEALQTGDIATLAAHRPALMAPSQRQKWFFLALEVGSLTAVQWFLTQGANARTPDPSGRLPLEALIQRATLADDYDDHLADCPAMAAALIAAGADSAARTLQGQRLSDLAQGTGLF